MTDLFCEICGYEDTGPAPRTVVQLCPDGIFRCKVCRHKLMYGHYIRDEDEEFRRFEAKDFTVEYKRLLDEWGEDSERLWREPCA